MLYLFRVSNAELGIEMNIAKQDLWVEENYKNVVTVRYPIKEILYSQKSEFQHVQIVETKGFGRMLLNDNIVMVSERDEFVYHEMIAHVPLFVHPHPKSVLVIGGGDGGTVREVLRHPLVKECTLVEIDGFVIEACKKFLPQVSSKLNDNRVTVHVADGAKYVKETSKKFDVVLVDSTDPLGPSLPLFGKEFYQNVYRILNNDGIVVSQCESPFLESVMQLSIMKTLHNYFPIVSIYNYTNLTYGGGIWSFSLASRKYHPIKDYDAQKTQDWDFRYYNPDVHRAAFALPNFMKQALKGYLS